MKKVLIFAIAAALAATAASAKWVYAGKWGKFGSGNGQFNFPSGVAVAPGGNVYVADTTNSRIQYFRWSGVAVSPASLGRVKALFR